MNNIFEFLKGLFSISNRYSLGALRNPDDKRLINAAAYTPAVSIPGEYITDLSVFPNQNQLGLGTCVAQWIRMSYEYLWYKKTGKNVAFSARSAYIVCKQKDGIPNQVGTYPSVAASVLVNQGIAQDLSVPDDNTLSYDKYVSFPFTTPIILEMQNQTALGYAIVNPVFQEICQQIYQNGVVGVSINVDSNWFNGIIQKVTKAIGTHRLVLYGYDADGFYGKNWWGTSWIAKIANKIFSAGDFYVSWTDYQDNLYDIMVFSYIPQKILDHVKGINYYFTSGMSFGNTSYDILQLQKRLKKEGFWGKNDPDPTGFYGSVTTFNVQAYQKFHGIQSDGSVVGPLTLRALNGASGLSYFDATVHVESGGNDYAIGDVTLPDHAYGAVQVRQGVVDEVNIYLKTSHKAQDTLGNRDLSKTIFDAYWAIHIEFQTPADRARAWNGGPGWKSFYHKPGHEKYSSEIDAYAEKIASFMI